MLLWQKLETLIKSKTVALGLMEVSCSKEWHKNRNLRKVRDQGPAYGLKVSLSI